MKKWTWIFVLTCAFGVRSFPAQAEVLPVETFFKDLYFTKVSISPDGKYLGVIADRKGRRNLAALDLVTRKLTWLSGVTRRDVFEFSWASNERLLFRTSEDGFITGGLYSINRDGSHPTVLMDAIEDQMQGIVRVIRAVDVLSLLPNDPTHVLVAKFELTLLSGPLSFAHPHVYRMDIFTGGMTPLLSNPGDVVEWVADRNGDVRAGLALEDGRARLIYRPSTKDPWSTLKEFDALTTKLTPLHFTADNKNLFVAANHERDTVGIYTFDTAKKEIAEACWHDPKFDYEDIVFNYQDAEVIGVYYHAERPCFDWLEPRLKTRQSNIDRALPDTFNRAVSLSRDGTRTVYFASNDRDPGTYYLFDAIRGRLEFIANAASWIKADQMARVQPVEFAARDALKIPGYLTLPREHAGKGLPMVVLPHGGPWARDTMEFQSDVQFLANRGYAVLQINFRGSTGYGIRFMEAGFKQWGLKMQDDITDGVKWSVAQGIADPKRIAIFGASYGGYAAMAGLTFTPDLYRCGINYAGVTDVARMLSGRALRGSKDSAYFNRLMVGDYRKEKDDLGAVSPIKFVSKIQAPLLLAYGERDPVVHIAQGRRLASELKRLNKPFEMIVESEEGHGFHIEENRVKLFTRIEKFLQKNMK